MAINVSTYTDPGVYVQESVVPGQVSVSTVPLTVALLGTGLRNKRVSNEALIRGQVSNEALTVAATVSAHDATLINVSNRKSANLNVYRDAVALDSAQVSFLQPKVVGATLTTLDFTTNKHISLALDGQAPVTIAITSGGSDTTTISGRLITQQLAGVTIGTLTATNIASGINKALSGASSLGYGTAYAAVAVEATNVITLTSPSTSSIADVRLYSSFGSSTGLLDRTDEVFGVSLPYQAPTVIRIANTSWSALSVYTADYVATNTTVDSLAQSDIQTMIKVGALAGVTTYVENTDYTRSGSVLSWAADSAAVFTSSVASATHDLSTNKSIVLAFDGRAAVTVVLTGMASPPPGYANAVSAAAATPLEIANNINAVFAVDASYGVRYKAVASVSGSGVNSKLVLTSPIEGRGSSVQIADASTTSASNALFGLQSSQMPYALYGVGSSPVNGAIFFATYEYTRPTTDYNLPKRYFTPDSLYQDVGFPTSTNQLAIAGGVAFDNGAPSVIIVQVNDSTFATAPTQAEIAAALTAVATTTVATDIIVLDTRLQVQVDLLNHVVNMSSATEKAYRRGWFGMARGTLIGDRDTADTFVYRATRTLQVASDSPGRGRLILVAPSEANRTITREDGTQSALALSGVYLAVAIAARMTAFTSPADTLLRKNITGFNTDTFTTYLKTERAVLAGNGVTVVTLDAGRLVLMDPITTEAGGGRMISFSEISASTQKDAVTTAMTASIDSNLVGVVPSDLSSFILTIKGYIGGVLRSLIAQGAIAPFRTADGVTRDVEFATDIQVYQDVTDPTKYFFRYFFNLRYPSKRFFGEYTVDSPFAG